jgi:hypothetical protein
MEPEWIPELRVWMHLGLSVCANCGKKISYGDEPGARPFRLPDFIKSDERDTPAFCSERCYGEAISEAENLDYFDNKFQYCTQAQWQRIKGVDDPNYFKALTSKKQEKERAEWYISHYSWAKPFYEIRKDRDYFYTRLGEEHMRSETRVAQIREEMAEKERLEEEKKLLENIPDNIKTEHTHILGPAGSGKTTLLEKLIVRELNRPDSPAMIILDPKGLMIDRLSRLEIFKKRPLVLVDPTCPTPPALGMFAVRPDPRTLNQTISSFSYIFNTAGNALSPKMQTPFEYAVRLMFTIPKATVRTLIDLLGDRGTRDGAPEPTSPFYPYIQRLDEDSRDFFMRDFYSTNYGDTKQAIRARLQGLIRQPELGGMFKATENKLDLLDCFINRKVVMVNTAMTEMGMEASSLFGRYIISQALSAAMARTSRRLAHLIVDEFQLYADEIKTPQMLQLAREYGLGITIAHQNIHGPPFNDALRNTISTNTSIKFASSPEGIDLNYMARDLRCDPDQLSQVTKTRTHARFAAFVRGFTPKPLVAEFPFGATAQEPTMHPYRHVDLVLKRTKLLAATKKPPSLSPPPSRPVSPPPPVPNKPQVPPDTDDWHE